MAHIIFYTKPGCLGGIRQKALLTASEHTVEERSSLATPWTPEALRLFFGQLPIAEWYNPNAPDVKAGKVVPGALPEKETLELFCREPILIKRPLMDWKQKNGGVCC
jgi:arsenate reductase